MTEIMTDKSNYRCLFDDKRNLKLVQLRTIDLHLLMASSQRQCRSRLIETHPHTIMMHDSTLERKSEAEKHFI